jgi:Fic family protein
VTQPSTTWYPLEDLPENGGNLQQAELRSLTSIWEEQRNELQKLSAVREFNERLLRRWAIETGIIERIYSLDRGVTQLLVEHGLNASLIPHHATDKDPEYVIRIIQDQYAAVEGIFDFVASRRDLSTSYIKELHALLTASQRTTEAVDQFGNLIAVELIRGEYKKRPNNPLRRDGSLHQYCPPEQVPGEMERLIELHALHLGSGVSPEVEAAWLHHRFAQIHPFQDGNGRVARALATLVFLRAGWLPLVVTDELRSGYIRALELADQRDLEPLVVLFAKIEKKAFLEALSVAQDVRDRGRRVHHAVGAIRDVLIKRRDSLRNEWDHAKELADILRADATVILDGVASDLKNVVGPLAPRGKSFEFFVDSEAGDGERSHWFRFQLIATARKLDYFVNPSIYHTWVKLGINTDSRAEILVSFHGIGHEFRGLLVASACYFRRDVTEENERSVTDVTSLADEPFQINYKEPAAELRERFSRWLDPVLVTGLEIVRRSI